MKVQNKTQRPIDGAQSCAFSLRRKWVDAKRRLRREKQSTLTRATVAMNWANPQASVLYGSSTERAAQREEFSVFVNKDVAVVVVVLVYPNTTCIDIVYRLIILWHSYDKNGHSQNALYGTNLPYNQCQYYQESGLIDALEQRAPRISFWIIVTFFQGPEKLNKLT